MLLKDASIARTAGTETIPTTPRTADKPRVQGFTTQFLIELGVRLRRFICLTPRSKTGTGLTPARTRSGDDRSISQAARQVVSTVEGIGSRNAGGQLIRQPDCISGIQVKRHHPIDIGRLVPFICLEKDFSSQDTNNGKVPGVTLVHSIQFHVRWWSHTAENRYLPLVRSSQDVRVVSQNPQPWQNGRMDNGLPTFGHVLWRWLQLYGLDAGASFARQGLTRLDIQPHSERVASEKWEGIVTDAMKQIEDSCAGLRAAGCWHPSDLGALGYAWLASSTLRTGFRRLERYLKIVGERASLSIQDSNRGLTVTLQQKRLDPELRATAADIIMSLIIDMCRVNAGSALRPVDVALQRRQPDCAKAYLDFYGCDTRFSAGEDSFTLAAHDVDTLMPGSNQQLTGVHDQILTQQLAALQRQDTATRCRALILENLTTGKISTEDIAKELHTSPRTLTRRLEEQGTQLQKLLDETRSELAGRYLSDPGYSISEVAFLLGFSQQSSLTRASKRWFGMSPKEYRYAHIRQSTN